MSDFKRHEVPLDIRWYKIIQKSGALVAWDFDAGVTGTAYFQVVTQTKIFETKKVKVPF